MGKLILVSVLLSLVHFNIGNAQTDTFVLQKIRSYTRYVDSLNKTKSTGNRLVVASISEGSITSGGKTIGGFGTTTLRSTEGDTVFRIEYHDNVAVNTYRIYYFKSDEVVYATLELTTTKSGLKSLFRKEEFYSSGNLVHSTITKKLRRKRYLYKTETPLYKEGMRMLTDFRKEEEEYQNDILQLNH